MDILWLGQPACHDSALVGGKAAHLSQLAADYLVPPGFCLTAAALNRSLQGASVPNADGASVPALPPALYDELAAAYRELAERCGADEPPVAVRSSALDEDGGVASFAGQHATYLNVVGADAVAAAVVACWASAQSPHARAYRRRQGLALDTVGLAVLVQLLVAADVSAVLFSTHPITGCQDELVINASWGLGESIVGGTVTPDSYVVRKADCSIVSRQIAEKQRMTVALRAPSYNGFKRWFLGGGEVEGTLEA